MRPKKKRYEVDGWIYRIRQVRSSWVIQRRSKTAVECWSAIHGWRPWVRGERWKVSHFRSKDLALAVARILPGVCEARIMT